MIRFRIAELIAGRERQLGRRIPLGEVAVATGISAQTLSNLRAPRLVVTNTAYVDALCRYFRCGLAELLELYPTVDEDPRHHVDELYPERRGGRGSP